MKKVQIDKGLSLPVKRRSGFLLIESLLALLLLSFVTYYRFEKVEGEHKTDVVELESKEKYP